MKKSAIHSFRDREITFDILAETFSSESGKNSGKQKKGPHSSPSKNHYSSPMKCRTQMKQHGSKISDESGKKLDNSPKYLALLIFLNFCVERTDSILDKPAGIFVQNPKILKSKSQKNHQVWKFIQNILFLKNNYGHR